MAEPPITIRASFSSFTPGDNLPITRVVIHSTCPNVGFPAASGPGAQHGTALFFASGNAGGSAHYVEGVDGEEHCVPENTISYHAPPNENSIGIEICSEGGNYPNNYSRDQWLSPQVWPAVQRTAARTRDLCQRYAIPVVKLSPADLLAGRRGICGHVDVSQAWHETDHTDPGGNFPWPEFLAEVNGGSGGDDPVKNLILARDKKGSGVWVGDGVTRRHVADPTELQGLQYWIQKRGGDPAVYDFDDLRVVGAAVQLDYGFIRNQIAGWVGAADAANLSGSEVLDGVRKLLAALPKT